jgi:hypothetical protein
MKQEKVFKRFEELEILKDGEDIFLPKKTGRLKGFPTGLDLENWELESISNNFEDDEPAILGVWAGGDWQEMTYFNIVVEDKKVYVVPFDGLNVLGTGKTLTAKEFKKLYKKYLDDKKSTKRESVSRDKRMYFKNY